MDICTSIFGSKMGEYLLGSMGRECGYLIHFGTNIENLKDELIKLVEKKNGVLGRVDAAKRNGEEISPDVMLWLRIVDEIIPKVMHFEDEVNVKRRCLYRLCLSRKACKITQDVLQLQNGGTFNNVAHPAPPPKGSSTILDENFRDFESRMTITNEVMEALKKEEVKMVGICGMGGVGKTTMVKQIMKRLEGGNLFDNVVMAVVSQSPNIWNIQSQIADAVGLTFVEGSESGRARKLYARLKEIKRILVILDDVWAEISLEAIGLPFGDTHNKGCKVLLTSRDLGLCNVMGSKVNFKVEVLTSEEAHQLFREAVGESCWNDPVIHKVAEKVADECGGLPIAIVTVGKALQNASGKREWDNALQQLKKSHPLDISSGMHRSVYSSIQFSYDYLESDQAKLCLLLCCLFPEDYDIPIEWLVRYGWGQGIFDNIDDTLDEARNRVYTLIGELRRRFLLLDSGRNEFTKMHDVVRDVAIFIASTDHTHGLFMVRCDTQHKGWPQKATYMDYTAISLYNNVEIHEIPKGLQCPKLKLLQVERGNCSEFSMENMFEGMKELKVLALSDIQISALPRSLRVLKNLRTLRLEECDDLTHISGHVIGKLESLEILSCAGCPHISELPREIGDLKQLRLLDTRECNDLKKIPHGLLSDLSRLEELYMACSFYEWKKGAVGGKDEGMASLAEVTTLSDHLKVLSIDISNAPITYLIECDESLAELLKDWVLKNHKIRFHVSIFQTRPSRFSRFAGYKFQNSLLIRGNSWKVKQLGTC